MKRYYAIDTTALQLSGLSLLEWTILENIQFLEYENGWCYASKKLLAKNHNITERGFYKSRIGLIKKGWLKTNKKHHLKVSQKWVDLSRIDSHNKHEYSSGMIMNKVPVLHEQSSDSSMNKVPVASIKKETKGRESVPSSVKIETETLKQAKKIALHLEDSLKASMQKHRDTSETSLYNWAKDIEMLIRLDDNTPEEIIRIIDWIHTNKDPFWISNIMSGKTLRKKFPQLWSQMSQDRHKPVSAKNKILTEIGTGKVFFDYPDKDLNARVHVCLYGDYNALYDFFRNKYLDKDKAVKVWAYIDEHVDSILITYRSKQS